MKKTFLLATLISSIYLANANTVRIDEHSYHVDEHNGEVHVHSYSEHLNNYNTPRVNNYSNVPRYNNDTINVNNYRGPYNNGYYPYHGWNQGPIGWSNGWNSGWNNGNNNGGWGAGLVEGLIGGIAATSLFNYFFNHNSTPTVAYVNSAAPANSYSTSSNDNSSPNGDQPPAQITNNTVIEDNSTSPGLILAGFGAAILIGMGAWWLFRRRESQIEPDRYHHDYDEDYGDERYAARDRDSYSRRSPQLQQQSRRNDLNHQPLRDRRRV